MYPTSSVYVLLFWCVLGVLVSTVMVTAHGTLVDLEAVRRMSRAAMSMMPVYKLGLMNAFLFASARRGDVANVEHLLSNNTVKAQANCFDENLQSPLHVAVQRGQTDVAAVLIEYGTSFDQCDNHGVTALAMAAFLVSGGVGGCGKLAWRDWYLLADVE